MSENLPESFRAALARRQEAARQAELEEQARATEAARLEAQSRQHWLDVLQAASVIGAVAVRHVAPYDILIRTVWRPTSSGLFSKPKQKNAATAYEIVRGWTVHNRWTWPTEGAEWYSASSVLLTPTGELFRYPSGQKQAPDRIGQPRGQVEAAYFYDGREVTNYNKLGSDFKPGNESFTGELEQGLAEFVRVWKLPL